MDFINTLIDNGNIPILSAFLLGILAALSPCTLAANIAAVAFLSRETKEPRRAIIHGLCYALGRVISYSILGGLIYFGFSTFAVSRVFEGWGTLFLGPVLIIIGLLLADIIKLRFKVDLSRFQSKLHTKGYLGSLLLGMVLALAFCPYSAVLFFGALIPLSSTTSSGLLLPTFFAIGTSLPVLSFACFLAFGFHGLSSTFSLMQKIEKSGRRIVILIFLLTGLYYSQSLLMYIINNVKY
jgi:cytochrome c biogenesis protein CcdA